MNSSIFAFNNHLTLVSYVPKKNKSVILVSTKHHYPQIDNINEKPQIIVDYNKLKGNLIIYTVNLRYNPDFKRWRGYF